MLLKLKVKNITPKIFFPNKYFNVPDVIEPDFHSLYLSRAGVPNPRVTNRDTQQEVSVGQVN